MATKKHMRKKCIHETPRYWYHISTTLTAKRVYLAPRDNRRSMNRSSCEPNDKRICVAPTVAHCLAAVPYAPGEKYIIYRTFRKCRATQPNGIYDAHITDEGWIQYPTMFERIGVLSLPDLAKLEDVNIPEESASSNCLQQCGKVLKWWQRRKPQQHIKRS
jgi:hypothetical protein